MKDAIWTKFEVTFNTKMMRDKQGMFVKIKQIPLKEVLRLLVKRRFFIRFNHE